LSITATWPQGRPFRNFTEVGVLQIEYTGSKQTGYSNTYYPGQNIGSLVGRAPATLNRRDDLNVAAKGANIAAGFSFAAVAASLLPNPAPTSVVFVAASPKSADY
jgi:hypothetical protein